MYESACAVVSVQAMYWYSVSAYVVQAKGQCLGGFVSSDRAEVYDV